MRQANELGGNVRKGEESTIVVFWKVEDLDQKAEDLDADGSDEKTRRRFLLRYYRVFNLEQCELPQGVLDLRFREAGEGLPSLGRLPFDERKQRALRCFFTFYTDGRFTL